MITFYSMYSMYQNVGYSLCFVVVQFCYSFLLRDKVIVFVPGSMKILLIFLKSASKLVLCIVFNFCEFVLVFLSYRIWQHYSPTYYQVITYAHKVLLLYQNFRQYYIVSTEAEKWIDYYWTPTSPNHNSPLLWHID